MQPPWNRSPTVAARLRAGGLAGIVAAGAYALELEADRRLFRHNADDLALLGRLVTDDPARARAIGLGMHLFNGAAAGVTYVLLARDRLPGPPWLRGTVASLIENTALYPLALLETRHPGFRDGHLDSYLAVPAFIQTTLRHIVFGAVLGPMTERLLANHRAPGQEAYFRP